MSDQVDLTDWESQREALSWPSPYDDVLIGLDLAETPLRVSKRHQQQENGYEIS